MLVPLLEHLHINQITVGVGREDSFRMLCNILKTRVNLKSFRVSEPINPSHIFAQPGQEARDSWGCKSLESLFLSLLGQCIPRRKWSERRSGIYLPSDQAAVQAIVTDDPLC